MAQKIGLDSTPEVMTTNQKIAKVSLILIVAGTLGHILSLGKEILVANYFGITKVMDAFYAAIAVPNMINNILVTTFGAIFIPVFIKYKLKNREEANHIASMVLNYLSVFFAFISVLLFVFAPWIIKYGFHGLEMESAVLAVKILRVVSFTVILSGLIGIFSSILNAVKCFTWPAYSRMFITIFTILFILLFAERISIFTLVYGLFVGLFVQFLFLIPIAWRNGFRYYFDFKCSAAKEMLSNAGLFFVVCVGGQINVLVDKIMASNLVPGSIAALGYAGRLIQVPLIIFSGAIATAVFPFFSSQVAENKIDEMKDSFAKSIRMSGFIFIPLTVLIVLFARPIIQLLFQRGAFTQEATDLTSIIFICYSFQLLFYAITMILVKIFLALRAIKILLILTALQVFMNIILNFVFIKIISPPAAGIALATSVISLNTTILLFIFLKKKVIVFHSKYIFQGLFKVAISAMISIPFTVYTRQFMNYIVPVSNLMGLGIKILISFFVFIGVFLFLNRLQKTEELNSIYYLLKTKFLIKDLGKNYEKNN